MACRGHFAYVAAINSFYIIPSSVNKQANHLKILSCYSTTFNVKLHEKEERIPVSRIIVKYIIVQTIKMGYSILIDRLCYYSEPIFCTYS